MIQQSLFADSTPARSGADLSPCGRYRYRLWRSDSDGYPERPVNFIMLNPSTADATVNDPTIRRCVCFARDWGYGGILVTNLYAWRATDPRELRGIIDPIGRENDSFLTHVADHAALIVCAWGTPGGPRARDVCDVLRRSGKPLHALRLTKEGHPAHPLYLPAGLTPVLYR